MDNPTEDHHSIVFPEGEICIPLLLWGIFTYFLSSVWTRAQMEECEDVYRLTPDGEWNPDTNVYSMNKENIVDWQGRMIEQQHCQRILLADVEEDIEMSASAVISSIESKMIDINFETDELSAPNPQEVNGEVSLIYGVDTPALRLEEMALNGHFKTSIGATSAYTSNIWWKRRLWCRKSLVAQLMPVRSTLMRSWQVQRTLG
jgi:hypothetical protein